MHSMWRRSEDVTGGGNAKEFQMRCEVCVRSVVCPRGCTQYGFDLGGEIAE